MAQVFHMPDEEFNPFRVSATRRGSNLHDLVRHLYPNSYPNPNPTVSANLSPWAASRSGDPELQLEVDLTILDYIAYKATETLLKNRRAQLKGEKIPNDPNGVKIEMVDTFLTYFNEKHNDPQLSVYLSFRLQLLQFVTLFVCRTDRESPPTTKESLSVLRAYNLRRGQHWRSSHPWRLPQGFDAEHELPMPQKVLHQYRRAVYQQLNIKDSDPRAWVEDYYGSVNCASLGDLLPLFLSLLAARVPFTGKWYLQMGLADVIGEWMMQAAVEQYLICGKSGTRALDAIYAVGYDGCAGEELGAIADQFDENMKKTTKTLFADEESPGTEVPGWEMIRCLWMNELLPTPDDDHNSTATTLLEAVAEHPIKTFEFTLIAFMEEMQTHQPLPDLQQVEDGLIQGVPEGESREMLKKMGLLTI